ncbi:receptor-type tyrosine-protein phosphatase kappa-like [Saccostrea cucullata]|uniref:receptor-type tyrosine-protein phosphatase kappa-like n=1 Tax=Saccostrea cuccullata TaxID=36930 RepID=UPI002ED67C9A
MWIVIFILCLYSLDLMSSKYTSVFQSSMRENNTNDYTSYESAFGNFNAYYEKRNGVENSLKILFLNKIDISCFTMTSRGGSFRITVVSKHYDSEYLCDSFKLVGDEHIHNVTRCCHRQQEGDFLVITRTDNGVLRLYEVGLLDCPYGYFGFSCLKCRGCSSCDAANGTCLVCPSFRYGETCKLECPENCSNCDIRNGNCQICERCAGECDKRMGYCTKCKPGFFQPPHCYRCKDSIRNCFQCNSTRICNECEAGYVGEQCEEESITEENKYTFTENSMSYDGMPKVLLKVSDLSWPQNEMMLENGRNESDNILETNDHLLPVLFGMIIFVLLLILLLIKRLKVLRKTETANILEEKTKHRLREEQPLNLAVPQNILGNEANTIFLEEITQADDIVLDEIQRLDVEYTNTIAHMIPMDKFIEYHSIRRENNIFEEEEFAKIPTGLMELYTEAVKKENICKNRYRYVYPYDFCRIVLSTSEEQGRNDYINACYVEGINGDPTYIAAQGPFTPATLVDFWRMTWQENSSRIVMLTNLFEGDHMKCLKYWPEEEDTFGDLVIRLESQDIYEKYTIRHLVVQQAKSEDKNPNDVAKKVTQFHFTGWPDCGVPSDVESLLCFRDLVKNGRPEADGPIIVHCSAGIGRTGTFIALDYLLEEGSTMESVDIINCVSKLRQQRAHSIQTKAQYIFLYDALAQGLKNIRRKSLYQLVDEI